MKENYKEMDSKYYIRKVIESKFIDNISYNLVLETYLDKDYLIVSIEKEYEVIWFSTSDNVSYTSETKSLRRAKLIELGEERFSKISKISKGVQNV